MEVVCMLWKIEKRNIDDLQSYEKNPRKFTKKVYLI